MKNYFPKIEALMKTQGISKKKLAEIAGVGPSAVTKWASGGEIRIHTLKKIADYFSVDLMFFLKEKLDSDSLVVNQSEIDWKSRALIAEKKLNALNDAVSLILKGTQQMQEAMK